ncbi:MAG: DUF2111 domain-containing protein [Halobacteriota archaeon]
MNVSFALSANSTSRDLLPVAMAVHEILNRLPVTMRSKNNRGIKIENGEVKSESYTGPVLETVLKENLTVKTKPESGDYKDIPVIVAPIRDSTGLPIAAIGIVDITGIFDLADLMKRQTEWWKKG